MTLDPRQILSDYIQKNIEECERGLKQQKIYLECLITAKKVYERYGEEHPSTYGCGLSETDIRREIFELNKQLREWQHTLAWFNNLITGEANFETRIREVFDQNLDRPNPSNPFTVDWNGEKKSL